MPPINDDLRTYRQRRRKKSEDESSSATPSTAEHALSAENPVEEDGPEVDVGALAERIYRLLKQELRVEQERLGRGRR